MFCTDSSSSSLDSDDLKVKRRRKQRSRGKRIRYYQDQRYQKVRRSQRIREPKNEKPKRILRSVQERESTRESTLSEMTDLDLQQMSDLESEKQSNSNQSNSDKDEQGSEEESDHDQELENSGKEEESNNENDEDLAKQSKQKESESQRSLRLNRRNRYRRRRSSSEDDDLGPRRVSTRKVKSPYYQRYNLLNHEDCTSNKQKAPTDYSKQLMPANFTQILDRESKLWENRLASESEAEYERRSFKSRKPSSSRNAAKASQNHSNHRTNRLNESDEDTAPVSVKGRIFGLLQGSNVKNQILPMNMNDMMAVEEEKLLKLVDQKTKKIFMEHKALQVKEKQVLDFDSIAGFDDHIMALKEMVGLPLMYPQVFSTFRISPPRGVLFHGPPGTGKTLMARALANSCSTSDRPVAFFMRKGADVLNKWVGESEKNLRILFEQAKAWQPSIIFFDEIDGLAPVRSSKQDQIHASVVSTLLSLMDGLDSRGQVVVIGATNRIDSIDPALRRPGRFDREFYFGLPKEPARKKIIEMATKDWIGRPSDQELEDLANMTRGYNGADCKALCTEAALNAVRRTYPGIYQGREKFVIDVNKINVKMQDFSECMGKLATERTSTAFGKPLPLHLLPLLRTHYQFLSNWMHKVLPILKLTKSIKPMPSLESALIRPPEGLLSVQDYLKSFSPRLCLHGSPKMGQDLLGSSLVLILEQNDFYVRTLDISALIANVDLSSPDAVILAAFCELQRHTNSALYLPDLHSWWYTCTQSTRDTLINLLDQTRYSSLLIILTMEFEKEEIPSELYPYFSNLWTKARGKAFGDWKIAYHVEEPDKESKILYYSTLLNDLNQKLIKSDQVKKAPPQSLTVEKIVPNSAANDLDQSQKEELLKEFQSHQRRIRQVFASFIADLKKTFRPFTKSVEAHLLTAYEIQTPMDLSIMQDKVEKNVYELPDDFMNDVRLILSNVIKFNDRDLITRARKLVDTAEEDISLLTPDFRQQCWSGVIPGSETSVIDIDSDEDKIEPEEEVPATQFQNCSSEHEELLEKEQFNRPINDNSEAAFLNSTCDIEDYPFSPIDMLPLELTEEGPEDTFQPANVNGFAEYLADNTPSFSVQDIEDVSAAIACQVVQAGRLDVNELKSVLNLHDQ